jgi:glycosyltransferase involved in cell wall biosynthesis
MKVAIINTYLHGGAGTAASRLQKALESQGISTVLLTRENAGNKWAFYAERVSFLPYEKDKSVRFSYSLANYGENICKHPDVVSADVLHLHWVNQGFLSLKNIKDLAALGKPIVWTLHDMWAFTGGCHYSLGCTNYLKECGNCLYLKNQTENDLSHRLWLKKYLNYPKNIHFITCSEWLGGLAKSSGLLKNHCVTAIPNPIDTALFKPVTEEIRNKFRMENGVEESTKLLLFVAMKVSETRKGFAYLQASLQILKENNPDFALKIMILGQTDPEIQNQLPYPVLSLGMVREEEKLAFYYGIADVFVIPSLEDNLPNTVMESIACGTPVVGFDTGGIPEMISDKVEGFIAPQKDCATLANGIVWVLEDVTRLKDLRRNARQKAVNTYANEVVVKRYLDAYTFRDSAFSIIMTKS